MSGQIIGDKLKGDFYWFDCPDCNGRMILLRHNGAYNWVLRCDECGKMYSLQLHLIYNPEEKMAINQKLELTESYP